MPRTAAATRRAPSRSGPLEHPVAVDARVDEPPHAARPQPLDHGLDRDLGLLGPARGGELARRARRPRRRRARRSSRDAPRRGSRRRVTRRCRAPPASAPALDRGARPPSIVRSPPPTWTGTSTLAAIRSTCSRLAGVAAARAVEVDDVQRARAGRRPSAARRRAGRRRRRSAASKSPRARRTALPSRMSIAGSRIMRARPPACAAPRRQHSATKFVEHPQAVRGGLLGVELDAEHRAARDDRREPLAVLGGADDVVGVARAGRERVHVVEGAAAGRAGPRSAATARSKRTSFQPMCGIRRPPARSARDLAARSARGRRSARARSERVEQQLHAQADPEHRRARRRPRSRISSVEPELVAGCASPAGTRPRPADERRRPRAARRGRG